MKTLKTLIVLHLVLVYHNIMILHAWEKLMMPYFVQMGAVVDMVLALLCLNNGTIYCPLEKKKMKALCSVFGYQ